MPAKRPVSATRTEARPQTREQARVPPPVALSDERRTLIESQIQPLSATARRIAGELPLSADVGDFLVALDEAAPR